MPQCVHCNHEFAVSQGFQCPSCGKDFRRPGGDQPSALDRGAPSESKPAHLAVLEGGGPPKVAEAKPRLVSTAGPAVPVLKKQNDSVPNGWMARLEAARMVASAQSGASAPASSQAPTQSSKPPAASSGPPPLKVSSKPKPAKPAVENKPAHLLVAQLQEEEDRRRKDEAARLDALFSNKNQAPESVANVEIELPTAQKKRKVSERLIIALFVVGGLGVVVGAYNAVKKEPAPKLVVDPALKAKAERRKRAVDALERGHSHVLKGKEGAQDAIKAYKEAIALDSELAGAERGLGVAYVALDEKAEALAHYKNYLKLAPEAKDAKEVRKIIQQYEKKLGKKTP